MLVITFNTHHHIEKIKKNYEISITKYKFRLMKPNFLFNKKKGKYRSMRIHFNNTTQLFFG